MHRSRGLFGILTWQQNNSQGRILFRDDCVSAGAIRRPALRYATWIAGRPADTPTMGIRTRGLDIGINAKRQVADAAAHAEAKAVVDRWNEQFAAGREMLPTIRAALIAGTPWLNAPRD